VLLLGIAALGAVAVLVLLFNFVSGVAAQVGPTASVLTLSAPVAAYQPVGDAVTEVEMPQRWIPQNAFRQRQDVEGLVAASDLSPGSLLQAGMLVTPPAVVPGERYVSMVVTPDVYAGEPLRPNTLVDIVATFRQGTVADGEEEAGQPAEVQLVIEGARVVRTGAGAPAASEEGGGADLGAAAPAGVGPVPVTFGLSVADALRMAYVIDVATQVHLYPRGPGDTADVPPGEERFQPEGGP